MSGLAVLCIRQCDSAIIEPDTFSHALMDYAYDDLSSAVCIKGLWTFQLNTLKRAEGKVHALHATADRYRNCSE